MLKKYNKVFISILSVIILLVVINLVYALWMKTKFSHLGELKPYESLVNIKDSDIGLEPYSVRRLIFSAPFKEVDGRTDSTSFVKLSIGDEKIFLFMMIVILMWPFRSYRSQSWIIM